MSKLARTLAVAALAAAALAVPATADAATRAIVEVTYTNTGSGYDVDCRAQALMVGIPRVSSCYASTASGSLQLCYAVTVSDALGFTLFYSGLRCSAPTAGSAQAGVGVYRV